jgi:formylglycine-generating enzyme required for sulfatase activity
MKKFLLIVLAAMAANVLLANNILVHNISLTGNNATSQYVMVKFDLSWDNSWRVSSGPANWDAAWVFIKYRIKGQRTWNHATLHYTDGSGSGDGHILPAGAAISSSNDNGVGGAYGVLVYHNSALSQGTVSYPGTELRWDYGVNGVSNADSVDIRVNAVEMVYVPQASFSVGSGGAETDAFFTYPDTTQPYTISSENAIPVAAVNGQLFYHHNSSTSGDGIGPIPAAFPKGYKAFYCMKYEITEDQYAAFLNAIDSAQLRGRIGTVPLSTLGSRNGIGGTTVGNIAALNPYLPCNFLNWLSLTAYLDWSALRPMTELEYEKACRGTALTFRNEFAWGSDGLVNYDPVTKVVTTGNLYMLSNPLAKDEGIAANYSSFGNAVWYATEPYSSIPAPGPLRAGIFAGNAGNSGRVTAGASFYGIMEMSGNLTEQVVTVGAPDGRAFTGQHGDGILRVGGDPNVPDWPYFTGTGLGLRGGSFGSVIPVNLTVSDRSTAADHSDFFLTSPYVGGRGVRTAP